MRTKLYDVDGSEIVPSVWEDGEGVQIGPMGARAKDCDISRLKRFWIILKYLFVSKHRG